MITDRRTFLGAAGATLASGAVSDRWPEVLGQRAASTPSHPYTVAAYYFGNYHVDPRNEAAHGPGWTEWRLVESAKPRFRGHAQPKVPLWGTQDESDPLVFEQKIRAASDHGLSAFIFDWYWYNDGPFLQRALENGYLNAKNRNDLKFSIMWANHDWYDIHPAKLSGSPKLLYPGKVTLETFRKLTDHVIENYFKVSSYWKIDGCPYFSIYELYRFIEGMGDVESATQAISDFRVKTKAAGFKDLHLNAVTWGVQLLPGQSEVSNLKELLHQLGVDSTTSYVWIHHAKMSQFPVTAYENLGSAYEQYRARASAELGKPYFPNVSMGWDSSPRASQTDSYVDGGYPYMPVIQGNTPAAFGKALRSAKTFLDAEAEGGEKVLTINSWNEWTEGSYLEPDTVNKLEYLAEIAKVFPKVRGS
jgi:Glycosyltransferase WbsX